MKKDEYVLIIENVLFYLSMCFEILFFLLIFFSQGIGNFFFGKYTISLMNNMIVSLIESNFILSACLIVMLYSCVKKYKDLLVLKVAFLYGLLTQILVSIINVCLVFAICYISNNNKLLLMYSQVIYVFIYYFILTKFLSRKKIYLTDIKTQRNGISNIFLNAIIVNILIIICLVLVDTKYDFIVDFIVIGIGTIYIFKKILSKLGIDISRDSFKMEEFESLRDDEKEVKYTIEDYDINEKIKNVTYKKEDHNSIFMVDKEKYDIK